MSQFGVACWNFPRSWRDFFLVVWLKACCVLLIELVCWKVTNRKGFKDGPEIEKNVNWKWFDLAWRQTKHRQQTEICSCFINQRHFPFQSVFFISKDFFISNWSSSHIFSISWKDFFPLFPWNCDPSDKKPIRLFQMAFLPALGLFKGLSKKWQKKI